MSAQDVVREAVEAFQRGDVEAALALMDDEIVWDNRGIGVPGLDEFFHGREGVLRLLTLVGEAFEEYGIGDAEYEGSGDRVLMLAREHGRGRASGVSIDRPVAWLGTVRDGRLVHVATHADLDGARRLLSGPPPPPP